MSLPINNLPTFRIKTWMNTGSQSLYGCNTTPCPEPTAVSVGLPTALGILELTASVNQYPVFHSIFVTVKTFVCNQNENRKVCICYKFKSILPVIFHAIYGTVRIRFTHLSFDDCENTCTLSYFPFAIFRVRSWNNGKRCMSFYILLYMQFYLCMRICLQSARILNCHWIKILIHHNNQEWIFGISGLIKLYRVKVTSQ